MEMAGGDINYITPLGGVVCIIPGNKPKNIKALQEGRRLFEISQIVVRNFLKHPYYTSLANCTNLKIKVCMIIHPNKGSSCKIGVKNWTNSTRKGVRASLAKHMAYVGTGKKVQSFANNQHFGICSF